MYVYILSRAAGTLSTSSFEITDITSPGGGIWIVELTCLSGSHSFTQYDRLLVDPTQSSGGVEPRVQLYKSDTIGTDVYPVDVLDISASGELSVYTDEWDVDAYILLNSDLPTRTILKLYTDIHTAGRSPRIYGEMFGLIPDTGDDMLVPLSRAIAYAESSNVPDVEVSLSGGDYYISAQVVLSQPNIVLAGHGTVRIRGHASFAGSGSLVKVGASATGSQLINLLVIPVAGAIGFELAGPCHVDRLTAVTGAVGFLISASVTFGSIRATNCTDVGVKIITGCGQLEGGSMRVSGCGNASGDAGVLVLAGASSISNLNVESMLISAGTGDGFRIEGSAADVSKIEKITIGTFHATGCGRHGFYALDARDIHVERGLIVSTGGNGALLDGVLRGSFGASVRSASLIGIGMLSTNNTITEFDISPATVTGCQQTGLDFLGTRCVISRGIYSGNNLATGFEELRVRASGTTDALLGMALVGSSGLTIDSGADVEIGNVLEV